MSDTNPHFEELTRDECLTILTNHSFGRLAVTVDGQPDIFPVNYLLDDDRIIFRSGPGTKLDHASLDRVAFEVDEFEHGRLSACSVVVKGTALEFTEAIDERSERERALLVATLMSSISSEELRWVRIVPRQITGRQLHQD
jgi:nitroimidazol reductase NimA-like FMN-containing flavoprotein (pyridoxamine 5'-phosphate oxidase superfamily)